ncbi:type II toxin-antitoxin system VapC family toxin [Ancylobacter dichloromethanicus]|uniref:PIN domain-containing protein n=1 Tax=Ancylobacter dichloromethanicus TaxID=518825 RepID=A0A9W6MZZ1_9HYPH|nr:type II toxin-antitoxin system VapC family toxin [Ancylobacter dichloromethanicus]MBS7554777.1 type II toxin-antitoxin system VapC family toxin [Ancylobacter dichloromethanicus]GLK72462.1 hypothetical protein GCM10017643_25780 [Ancylobacter dichloromethanicus]
MGMPLLLDTCAALWIAQGAPISDEARGTLIEARLRGAPISVSPMSAWELGRLVEQGRVRLAMEPAKWFAALAALPGMSVAAMTPDTLIASSFLPGVAPLDPVDRVLIATARDHGYRLMTRDRVMLDYAETGYLQAIAC